MKQVSMFIQFVLLVSFLAISCSDNSSSPSDNITITSINPATGQPGDPVVITGKGFGSSQGSSTVTFNGVKAATSVFWADTLIHAVIPATATTGKVMVNVNGKASNGVDFTVILTPVITNITPVYGKIGSTIKLKGKNFGPAQGSSTLKFGDNPISAASWSNTEITFVVPQTDNNQVNLEVTVNGKTSSDQIPLLIAVGGNPASTMTGVWMSEGVSFYGSTFYYYFYISEENGTITGSGIKYMTSLLGDLYSAYTLEGTFTSPGTINMTTSSSGFGSFTGTLSGNKTTISGKSGNNDFTFTKKVL